MKKYIVIAMIIAIAFLLVACREQAYPEATNSYEIPEPTMAAQYPDPAPDSVPDFAPTLNPVLVPDPVSDPVPAPALDPAPDPDPEPDPDPAPDPDPPPEPDPPSAPAAQRVDNITISLRTPGGMRSGTFSGYLIDGVPNGHGVFSSASPLGAAWTYTGDFVDGVFHGYGETQWVSGQRRVGFFRNGEIYNGRSYDDDGNHVYSVVNGNRVRP